MEILKDYEGTLVVQRNPITGCIPSAIEWMMKYKGVEVPNDFQEKRTAADWLAITSQISPGSR